MTSNLVKKLAVTGLVGLILFGNLEKGYSPVPDERFKKENSEYFFNYFNKKKARDDELMKYSQFIGKPLIDKWIQDAIEKIKPHKLIDVPYVLATMKQESKFRPYAKSHVGARGLMQIMPDTWNWIDGKNSFYKESSDPDKNLEVGIKVLDKMANFCEKNYSEWDSLTKEGKIALVSAAYNGGNGTLQKKNWDVNKMPMETRNYVPSILEFYKNFKI